MPDSEFCKRLTCISIILFQAQRKRAVSHKRFQLIRTVLKRAGVAAHRSLGGPASPHRISLRLSARLLRLPLKGGVILRLA